MLEQMRSRGASIFIYLLFGMLIAAFVITLGPSGSGGGGSNSGGCGGNANTAIEVDGNSVNLTSYRVAFSNPWNQEDGEQNRRYFALEMLIRRELLADEAESRGIRVSGDMVDSAIKKGFFFFGGERIPLGQNIYETLDDGTKIWSTLRFKRFVSSLDVRSTSSYRDEQTRSMQATLMAELLKSTPRVSKEEAKTQFIYDHTTVSYDNVKFLPSSYRAAMRLTAADVQRYLSTHEAEVKAKYAAEERGYKATKPAVQIRKIFIAKADVPTSAGSADAGSGAAPPGLSVGVGPAGASVPYTLPIAQAKAQLEAMRTAILAGKVKFADAASKLATDEEVRTQGGEVGWRSVDSVGLGDPAVNDAVKTLKPGELSPVIVTDAGVYLVQVEDQRSGDLSYDRVKLELAEGLARDTWSREAAKRDALKAVALASVTPLDKQFELQESMPSMPKFDPSKMTPEQQEQINKMIQEQINKQKSGSLEPAPSGDATRAGTPKFAAWSVETTDVLAAWSAPDDTGGSASTPAAGSATGSAVPSAEAPAVGSAAGSAAAGAAAVPVPATAPLAAAATDVVASADVLPTFGHMDPPKLTSQVQIKRMSQLPDVGKDATADLFGKLQPGQVASRVYEVEDAYVVVQLVARDDADLKEFDQTADEAINQLQQARGVDLVYAWLSQKCHALAKEGKIIPAADMIRNSDAKGTPLPTTYRPCMSLR